MDSLRDAIQIIDDYNKMSFNQFADIMEVHFGKISKEDREEWKFTGLNNVDFYKNRT